MKDVWPLLLLDESNASFDRAMRPLIKTPSDLSQDGILKRLQEYRGQMGMVRDATDQKTLGCHLGGRARISGRRCARGAGQLKPVPPASFPTEAISDTHRILRHPIASELKEVPHIVSIDSGPEIDMPRHIPRRGHSQMHLEMA